MPGEVNKPKRMPFEAPPRQVVDVAAFIEKFCILGNGKPFILEDWQKGILRGMFAHDETGKRRYQQALVMLPKKNGKSSLAAALVVYFLLADPLGREEDPPEVYGLAGSRDQARIIFRQVSSMVRNSPALSAQLEVRADSIVCRNGEGFYQILSTDHSTLHGLNPSALVVDEFWQQVDYKLMAALTFSPSRQEPFYFFISYDGFSNYPGVPLFDMKKAAREQTDPGLFFFTSTGPDANLASWVSAEYLASQRRRLPDLEFRRLHFNEEVSETGTFLAPSIIRRAVDPSLAPRFSGQETVFFAGVDLGLTNDRTAVAVVHRDPLTECVVLDNLRIWKGTKQNPVNIQQVEDHLADLTKNFRIGRMLVDPFQAAHLTRRLQERGLPIEPFTFSANNLVRLATTMHGLFNEARIKLFDDDHLISELSTVRVKLTTYGFRLYDPGSTHDDRVTALALASLGCMETPTAALLTKQAFVRQSADGPHYVLQIDGQCYRFRLLPGEQDQECVTVIGPDQRPREFFDRQAFSAYLTQQHGPFRLIQARS